MILKELLKNPSITQKELARIIGKSERTRGRPLRKQKIKDLHKRIYKEILREELTFDYRPHITLGCTKEKITLSLDEEFESTVEQLSVELIGENEESNIIIQAGLSGS